MTAAVAVLSGSVPVLLLGLLFRELRKTPTPDPSDPSLTPLQRVGIERTRAAARMSSAMIKIGLGGITAGGIGVLAAYLVR